MSISLGGWKRNSEKKARHDTGPENCSNPIPYERQVSHVNSHHITTGLVDGEAAGLLWGQDVGSATFKYVPRLVSSGSTMPLCDIVVY